MKKIVSAITVLVLCVTAVTASVDFQVVSSTVTTNTLTNTLDSYTWTPSGSYGGDAALAQIYLQGYSSLSGYGEFADTDDGSVSVACSITWRVKWLKKGTPSGSYSYSAGWRSKGYASSAGHFENSECSLNSVARSVLETDSLESVTSLIGEPDYWARGDVYVNGGYPARHASFYFEEPEVDPYGVVDGTLATWSTVTPISGSTTFSLEGDGYYYAYITYYDVNPDIIIELAAESFRFFGELSVWGEGQLYKQYRLEEFDGQTMSSW